MAVIKKHPTEEQITLYSHQQEAMAALDKANEKENFSGIVVIPTGGGKTMTAAYWLMKNAVNNHAKIIWIAHRNLLLEQAYYTLEKCTTPELMPDRENFSMKIVSGEHEAAASISRNDEVLLVSRQSLQKNANVLDPWLMDYSGTVYCVIDECHHSAARTYQKIYGYLTGICRNLKVIGLTATPFRTIEEETGILQKIFYDDIIYKTDLKVLIKKGILAYPKLVEVQTRESFGANLPDEIVRQINNTDNMPELFAKEIADNVQRNRLIVKTYCENREEYGKCIVFAVNRLQAMSLSKLFEQHGIKAETIISEGQNTQLILKNKDNARKIESFKYGNLNVLINVLILTEGADFPKAHTVFLTRPTTSRVLMTQMVGRALRGPNAGGTKDAYIVSFIDDWQCKIAWESPSELDGYAISELENLQSGEPYATEKISVSEDEIADVTERADAYLKAVKPSLEYETKSIDISNIIGDLSTEEGVRQLFAELVQTYKHLHYTEKPDVLESDDKKLIVAVDGDGDETEVNLYKWEALTDGTMTLQPFGTSDYRATLTKYFYEEHEEPKEKKDRIEKNQDKKLRTVLRYCETVDEISTSYIQRHFRLGYARAARIMDQLEELGAIEPYAGAKPRKVHKDVLEEVLKRFEE